MAYDYTKVADTYEGGKRFLPKDAKIQMFWEKYPNGCIEVSVPVKDSLAEGIICTCKVYRDSVNKERSLLAESFARRVAATERDAAEGEIDLFAAVRAAAISDALALAGINLPVDEIYRYRFENTVSTINEEAVLEVTEDLSEGAPVEEIVPEAETAQSEESSEASAEEESVTEPDSETPDEESEGETEAESPAEDTPEIEEDSEAEEKSDNEPESEEEISEDDIPEIDAEPEKASQEEAPVETESSDSDNEEVTEPEKTEEELLMEETGVSYEEALATPYSYQTRKGVLGDLRNDPSSRALLKWMAGEKGFYYKKHPEMSKIAKLIVIHEGIK